MDRWVGADVVTPACLTLPSRYSFTGFVLIKEAGLTFVL